MSFDELSSQNSESSNISLSKLLREYKEEQQVKRKQNVFHKEINRLDLIKNVTNVSGALVDGVNLEVLNICKNQQKIKDETKKMDNQTLKLSKKLAQWNSSIDNLNNSLKEIGDIENWVKVMSEDMREIEMMLNRINSEGNEK